MKPITSKHLIVVALMFLSSCVAYYPQVVDIPLITGKRDIRVDAGIFLAPNIHGSEANKNAGKNDDSTVYPLADAGVHASFSYGLTDILAIQAYFSFDAALRFHLQGALVAYHAFENKTVIEMYGGFGYGNGLINSLAGTRDDYFLSFTQFNIGKVDQGSSHIDYGLGLKGGYIFCNFDNIWRQETIHKQNGWLIEPSVFFRFGGRKAKYCTKVNYLWTNTIEDDWYIPLCMSMVVNLNF